MPETPSPPGTAVIFVHGMGSQKRLAEVSELVEVLEQRPEGTSKGALRRIEVKLEPSNVDPKGTVTYLEAAWRPASGGEPGADSTSKTPRSDSGSTRPTGPPSPPMVSPFDR